MLLLNSLPETFNRKFAVEVGSKQNIPSRTIDRLLNGFIKSGKLVSPMVGTYNKN
jgi:hypothetical protein